MTIVVTFFATMRTKKKVTTTGLLSSPIFASNKIKKMDNCSKLVAIALFAITTTKENKMQ
jgi:hypothetical protein